VNSIHLFIEHKKHFNKILHKLQRTQKRNAYKQAKSSANLIEQRENIHLRSLAYLNVTQIHVRYFNGRQITLLHIIRSKPIIRRQSTLLRALLITNRLESSKQLAIAITITRYFIITSQGTIISLDKPPILTLTHAIPFPIREFSGFFTVIKRIWQLSFDPFGQVEIVIGFRLHIDHEIRRIQFVQVVIRHVDI
jgi:hypothetical protein